MAKTYVIVPLMNYDYEGNGEPDWGVIGPFTRVPTRLCKFMNMDPGAYGFPKDNFGTRMGFSICEVYPVPKKKIQRKRKKPAPNK